MLYNIDPTKTSAWSKLKEHRKYWEGIKMNYLFEKEVDRFDKFSMINDDILLDYSKNIISEETMDLLIKLADECKLSEAIESMFTGEKINVTENRSVLHTALRSEETCMLEGLNITNDIKQVQQKMESFCQNMISGSWKGYDGNTITDIVNIGIGGSDLGPVMVTEALKHYKTRLNVHFISNVDATHIAEVTKDLDMSRTLFLIASKTFTTQETMANAFTARTLFLEKAVDEEHIKKHFVAMSTNKNAVISFGIDPENMFEFWDWVGGRYSLTSAIGLSIALSIGFDNFKALLSGFNDMDNHFRKTKFESNMPVILALIGVWYVNFFDVTSEAILPYDQYMHRFAAYFQQANMESNGKSIDRDGNRVTYATGPVIWGEPGTNGQHAFYQLIHQGTSIIPCDFIAPAQSHNPIGKHHELLLSNYFAQTQALMIGKSADQVMEEFKKMGLSESESIRLTPFKVFEGNKPSNSILVKKIDPKTLGQLIALYEHKIFVQGIIWNIFSFDQWGVELGKQLATKIIPELKHGEKTSVFDSSTNGLINTWKDWSKN